MKRILSLLVVTTIAACTTNPSAPTRSPTEAGSVRPAEATPTPSPPPGPPPATPATEPPEDHTSPDPKPAGGAAIGETCGPGDACVAGAECVSYFGIAGARGPRFKSCEIKCSGKGGACPAGRSCVTIADGPGSVCR